MNTIRVTFSPALSFGTLDLVSDAVMDGLLDASVPDAAVSVDFKTGEIEIEMTIPPEQPAAL